MDFDRMKKYTKEEVLELLVEHEKYVKDYNTGSKLELKNAMIEDIEISDMDLSYIKLENVYVKNLKMVNVQMERIRVFKFGTHEAKLENVEILDSDITNINMPGTEAFNCEIAESSIGTARLSNSLFKNIVIEKCKLLEVDFDWVLFENSELSFNDFNYPDFKHASFNNVVMYDNKFLQGKFLSTEMVEGSFLKGYFYETDLKGFNTHEVEGLTITEYKFKVDGDITVVSYWEELNLWVGKETYVDVSLLLDELERDSSFSKASDKALKVIRGMVKIGMY